MLDRTMAKVTWAAGISTVSGALTKINKKSPHAADQTMLLANHRVAPSQSTDCNRLDMRGLSSITRTTPLSADEQAVRTKFAAVSAAVAARKKDLALVSTDQANFLAQKDDPRGKKTYNAYLWKICGDLYDQQNG